MPRNIVDKKRLAGSAQAVKKSASADAPAKARENVGVGTAAAPALDVDCSTLKLGDVARLRRRMKELAAKDSAPQALKELVKTKRGAIEAMGKVEMCRWLRPDRRVLAVFYYALIPVADAPLFSICPITHKVMERPATLSSGTTVEHAAGVALLKQTATAPLDPLTGAPLVVKILIPNLNLALAIRNWVEEHYALKGREIDPESPWDRENRLDKEKERKYNNGTVTRTGVDAVLASWATQKYRRFRVTLVKDAHLSDQVKRRIQLTLVRRGSDVGSRFPDIMRYLRGARVRTIGALWTGVGQDVEINIDKGSMVGVNDLKSLKLLLHLLAEKRAIQSIRDVHEGEGATMYARDHWDADRWLRFGPQSLTALGTIHLVLASPFPLDRLPDGVPELIWRPATTTGARVFFIELNRADNVWRLRMPGDTRSQVLAEPDSDGIASSYDLLVALRLLHDAGAIDYLFLGTPPSIGHR